MDMTAAYKLEVERWYPNAETVPRDLARPTDPPFAALLAIIDVVHFRL